jgi:hypothetical protein
MQELFVVVVFVCDVVQGEEVREPRMEAEKGDYMIVFRGELLNYFLVFGTCGHRAYSPAFRRVGFVEGGGSIGRMGMCVVESRQERCGDWGKSRQQLLDYVRRGPVWKTLAGVVL